MRSSSPLLLRIAFVGALIFGSPAEAFTLGGTSSSQLGWATSEITFNLNYADCGISEFVMDRAVDAAIALWNSVPTSGLVLRRGSSVTTAYTEAQAKVTARSGGNPSGLPPENPEILCSLNFEADTGSPASVVGGTTRYIAPAGPHLEYAYITLNSETGAAASLSEILDGSGEAALAILIAHEMGHALGLGHTADSSALMFFSISEKLQLGLSQDDIDGISYLYPRREFGGDGLLGCGMLHREDDGPGEGGGGGPWGGAVPFFGLFAFMALTAHLFKSASSSA